MRFPGYRGCSWTSKDRKGCHWIWKFPSSSSLGAGGSPVSLLFSLSAPFSCLSLQTCFLIHLWLFCCPQTCPGLGHGRGQTSACVLGLQIAPPPSSIHPTAHSLLAGFPGENLVGSFGVTCPLVQSAMLTSVHGTS